MNIDTMYQISPYLYFMIQTMEQIQEILKSNNIRFEMTLGRFDEPMIGIALGRGHNWSWFYLSEERGLVFDHTYSQVVGTTKKNYAHRSAKYKALDKLNIKNLYTGI